MQNSKFKKEKWEKWEGIASSFYVKKGFLLVVKNYIIRWGEIDLIMENEEFLVFIEVKVVDWVKDIYGYVTKRKLANLQKTIATYLRKHINKKKVRMDVVFIKNNRVYERYKNITNN